MLALTAPLPAEQVPLAQAAGRVLAQDGIAGRAQPPFDASAMDGYAVRAADAQAGATLRVIGQAAAGHGFAGGLGPGEAVRIFTGAPVPPGANRVVIQEDVTRDGDRVTLNAAPETGTNIRVKASDFAAGDRLGAPRRLGPNDLALLAAMNLGQVSVARRPVVALIATGDELRMPGERLGEDEIAASNIFALRAMAQAEGAEVRLLPIARDTETALTQAFALAQGADLIVTVGGASVGDHDLVGRVAEGLGMQRAFYKIAMRPGKPLMAGRLGATVMLGLPGNPVSAIVCGHLFMLPAVRALQGLPDPAPRLRRGVLAQDVPANGPRTHYMRAVLTETDALPRIRPFASQDSALLGILARSNALLVRPPQDAAQLEGALIQYMVV